MHTKHPGQAALCWEVKVTVCFAITPHHPSEPSRLSLLTRSFPIKSREKGPEYQTEPWALVPKEVQTGSSYTLVGLGGSLQFTGLPLATMLVRTM